MKTQLTADDPVGWYECESFCGTRTGLVYYWSGVELLVLPGERKCAGSYTNFRKLYTEDEVEKLKGECIKWASLSGQEKREIIDLKRELDRLKAAPYPMRKADKPDCVGLWLTTDGRVLIVDKHSLDPTFWAFPPYYYLGPIPVVPQQLPPKVVRVRNKNTGETLSAIAAASGKGFYNLLNDGTCDGYFDDSLWKEVQS